MHCVGIISRADALVRAFRVNTSMSTAVVERCAFVNFFALLRIFRRRPIARSAQANVAAVWQILTGELTSAFIVTTSASPGTSVFVRPVAAVVDSVAQLRFGNTLVARQAFVVSFVANWSTLARTHVQVFITVVARAAVGHSVTQTQHIEANTRKLTAEFKRQVASDILAELCRLVAAVAAVVIAVAQKLAWHAHRVGTLPLERRAGAAVNGLGAVGFVRSVSAVFATVAPEIAVDAHTVVAFALSDATGHAFTISFIGAIRTI